MSCCGNQLQPGREFVEVFTEEAVDGWTSVGPVLLRLTEPVHHQEERRCWDLTQGVETGKRVENSLDERH